ncbi:MAG: beta-phosphoglucomutase [Bacteroidota bacterium]
MNNRNHFKAFIFDLDGVIVDTAVHHYSAWRRMANRLGFDINEKFNEQLKGVGRMESLEAILDFGGIVLSENEKVHYAKMKNQWYQNLIKDMTPDEILPGAKAFLDHSKKLGYKICLGSASKNARAVIRSVKLESIFDAIVDGTDVIKSKPDPEVFLNGATLINVPPTECIVFEDAEKGIEAALNAQMTTIGVGKPGTLPKAHFNIEGFADLTPEGLLEKLTETLSI